MNLKITGLKVDAGSGEGSRGGRVIGHSSSGEPIYASKKGKDLAGNDEHTIHHEGKEIGAIASRMHTPHRKIAGSRLVTPLKEKKVFHIVHVGGKHIPHQYPDMSKKEAEEKLIGHAKENGLIK